MIVVGLTGKYCAGKNLVSSRFEHRGIPVLDVDKLGHDAIKSSHDILLKCFGTGIVGQSGEVDRKRLGAIVFSDAAQLARLEAIVHPKMVEACPGRLPYAGNQVCGIECSLVAPDEAGCVVRCHLLCGVSSVSQVCSGNPT